MSDSKFKIIAGLGNPGKNYALTRHNVGFLAIEALALKSRLSFDKSRFDAQYVKGKFRGISLFLIKPQSYMNRSGIPLHRFASYYKIQMKDIIVIHDDLDLAFGKIKIVKNRGHGGHNGVRSIFDAFGNKECIRIRIGVSHPESQRDVSGKSATKNNIAGYVLGNFSGEELKILGTIIDKASDACIHIFENGVASAMNLFN